MDADQELAKAEMEDVDVHAMHALVPRRSGGFVVINHAGAWTIGERLTLDEALDRLRSIFTPAEKTDG